MAWEENPRICLHMQLIAILSRTEVGPYISTQTSSFYDEGSPYQYDVDGKTASLLT